MLTSEEDDVDVDSLLSGRNVLSSFSHASTHAFIQCFRCNCWAQVPWLWMKKNKTVKWLTDWVCGSHVWYAMSLIFVFWHCEIVSFSIWQILCKTKFVLTCDCVPVGGRAKSVPDVDGLFLELFLLGWWESSVHGQIWTSEVLTEGVQKELGPPLQRLNKYWPQIVLLQPLQQECTPLKTLHQILHCRLQHWISMSYRLTVISYILLNTNGNNDKYYAQSVFLE